MNRWTIKPLLCWFLMLVAICMATPAGALAPAANSFINNQAQASYLNTVTASTETVLSAPASVRVASAPGIRVEGGSSITIASPIVVNLPFRLTNTGNVSETFDVFPANEAGDDFDLAAMDVRLDTNANGIANAGEPVVTSVTIGPGSAVFVVVTGTAPAGLSSADVADVRLQATAQSRPAVTDSDTDRVVFSTGLFLDIQKTASPGCSARISPGDLIHYDIDIRNNSAQVPPETALVIDGVNETGILLDDEIPANVRLAATAPVAYPLSAEVLVQLVADAGSNRWVRYGNWDGVTPVRALGLRVPASSLEPTEQAGLNFDVVSNDILTTGTLITNQAVIDLDGDGHADFSSAQVCTGVSTVAPGGGSADAQISFTQPVLALRTTATAPDFFNDADFEEAVVYRLDTMTGYNQVEDGVYLELESSSLNLRAWNEDGDVEEILVRLRSQETNDFIDVVMLETGLNTGKYRSLRTVRLINSGPGPRSAGSRCGSGATSANYTLSTAACHLLSVPGDRLEATIFDPGVGTVITDAAVVDPYGIVFDAATGNPVEGVEVRVIDVATGQQARDPETGGATALPVQVTGPDGHYAYPTMYPGSYYLEVTPPASWGFPSRIASGFVPPGFIVSDASYGRNGFSGTVDSGVFTLSPGDPPLVIDVPLDSATTPTGALVLSKNILAGPNNRVSYFEAELGDRVRYQVKVTNTGNNPAPAVTVLDRLPFGYRLEPDSVRLNNIPVVAVERTPGVQHFAVGNLAAGESATLDYVLHIRAGALDSDGINTAWARSSNGQKSNVAQARVKLRQDGVLSDRAILFGKLYLDSNCNRQQDHGEMPVGGVRLYMEDGTSVTTDENGQYSLYGLRPGNRVLRMDKLTLPARLIPTPVNTRHGADGYSRFVDLVPGDFHKADFVFKCPAPDVLKSIETELRARNQSIKGDWLLDQAERYQGLLSDQASVPTRATPAEDGDLSAGVLGGDTQALVEHGLPPASLPVAPPPEVAVEMPDIEAIANEATAKRARQGEWLWPEKETDSSRALMALVRADVKVTLELNGKAIGQEALGGHAINRDQKAQVLAWYGLPMEAGNNQIEIVTQDMFGNRRVLLQRTLYVPGAAKKLKLVPEAEKLVADGGRSTLPVRVQMLDANGKPARGLYFITVEATEGSWLEADVQEKTPGHQVRVVNGEAWIHLRSSDTTGQVQLRATLENMTDQQQIEFVPALRPMVAVGLIDLHATVGEVDTDLVEPTALDDQFAERFETDGRVAFFLKGKIKGDLLLTMAYDSDKQDDAELLRDIDPNAYYPVYGDSSVKAFEAQSRSKLYVKLEKDRSSIMWGDYQTDIQPLPERSVATYRGTHTGVNARYKTDKVEVRAFAAEQDNPTHVDQFPGRGTATGYRLTRYPIVPQSERVVRVTVSRDNARPGTASGLVIKETELERFRDYELNDLSGFLTFYEPVPTRDENGDLVYIKVTYQSTEDMDAYKVGGIRAAVDVHEKVTVGGTMTRSDAEENGFAMGSVFTTVRPTDNQQITVEAASRNGNGNLPAEQQKGNAGRVSWEGSWDKFTFAAEAARAQDGFTNPDATISAGREEARANAVYRVTDKARIKAEAQHSGSIDRAIEDDRDMALVAWEQDIGRWTVEAGGRRVDDEGASPSQQDYGRLAAGRGFSLFSRPGRVEASAERQVDNTDIGETKLGARLSVHDHLALYSNLEKINSYGGLSSADGTVEQYRYALGAQSDLLENASLYNEYRVRSTTDGREMLSVSGMRGQWEIKPGLKLAPAIEVVDTMDGNEMNDVVSVSTTLSDQRNKDARKAIRLETRDGKGSNYYAADLSYVARMNLDWSILLREAWSMEHNNTAKDPMRNLLTVGLSRRPKHTNIWNSLYLYQWKQERHVAEDRRIAHIVSTHQNVEVRPGRIVSGRLAFKHQDQHINSEVYASRAWLAGGRYIHELGRRWDVDLRAGVLSTTLNDDYRYSAGAGFSYLVNRNLRVGLSYNVVGFRDKDLDPQNFFGQGLHLNLQWKFDEELFNWLR